MQTQTQIGWDARLGGLLCYLLRIAVRIVGKILGLNHALNRDFERIVVCKFKGMGSIVQASALLRSLRIRYPEARLVFLSTKANRAILEALPDGPHEIWLVDDRSLFVLLRSSLNTLLRSWRFRPQLYLDLEVYSNYSSLMCTLSCATNRIGFYKSDKEYRSGLYTHLMYYNIKAPLSEIYLQMLRLLPGAVAHPHLQKPKYQSSIEHIKASLSINTSKYLVINPNASDLRLERRWPAASFVALCKDLLEQQPEFSLVFTGGPAEAGYVQQLLEQCPHDARIINSSGRLSLDSLLSLMAHANAVITNDTGPLHLALAFQIPTVGLFGPCAPSQYGQMERCIPVYRNLYCSPCVHEFSQPPCRGDNQCMKQIQTTRVMQALDQALNQQFISGTESIRYAHPQGALGFVNNREPS